MRAVIVLFGLAAVVLGAGFLAQAGWAMGLWPWLGSGYLGDPQLSAIFLASICAAIAAPVLWIGLAGELAAAVGGALNLALTGAGLSAYLFSTYPDDRDRFRLVAGGVCALASLVNLGLLWATHRSSSRDARPQPALVRLSFVLFAAVLVPVGLALLTGVQDVYPWWLDGDTSALYGWIYLGAASYFVYGALRPRWSNACGQLLGFLAYDVVLLPPFLSRLTTVDDAHRTSLLVYTAVLAYSALLACYYLLIHRPTRIWQRTAQGALP